MAIKIVELFGYGPSDRTKAAVTARRDKTCPFIINGCTKVLGRDGKVSGVCTVRQATLGPVIICPHRLYANGYRILKDIGEESFGQGIRLVASDNLQDAKYDGRDVIVFGKRWGKELKLPKRGGIGSYFVDWILALVDKKSQLEGFVAVEVQSMDTTGNYRDELESFMAGKEYEPYSAGGINWENVSKRILPQIIYKGNVLRRERLCTKGLFFVCPTPVYERIKIRLGDNLLEYPNLQPGSLTFRWYDVGETVSSGMIRKLEFGGQFRTTVDQVALAFTSPSNLPPPNVYEEAIKAELNGSN